MWLSGRHRRPAQLPSPLAALFRLHSWTPARAASLLRASAPSPAPESHIRPFHSPLCLKWDHAPGLKATHVYGFLITSCSLGDIASLHSAIFYFNMVLLLVRVTLLQWRGF